MARPIDVSTGVVVVVSHGQTHGVGGVDTLPVQKMPHNAIVAKMAAAIILIRDVVRIVLTI